MSSDSSTFLFFAFPISGELFSAKALASWHILPQCGQVKRPSPSITENGFSSGATNKGKSGAIRAGWRSTSNILPQPRHSQSCHASTVSDLIATTGERSEEHTSELQSLRHL